MPKVLLSEDGLNTFMEGMSTIKKISLLALQNWKKSILEQVDSKIGKKAPVIKSKKPCLFLITMKQKLS